MAKRPQPDSMPGNLIACWRLAETRQPLADPPADPLPLQAAIDSLNRALGAKLYNGRVNAWEHGKRAPSPETLRYLIARSARLALVLAGVLSEAEARALPEKQVQALAALLSPPQPL